MECTETSLTSTRIELFGCSWDGIGVYIGFSFAYMLLLIVRQIWWTRMGQAFRETLSYGPSIEYKWKTCSCRRLKSQRRLGIIFVNEFINSLMYILNLFLIVGKSLCAHPLYNMFILVFIHTVSPPLIRISNSWNGPCNAYWLESWSHTCIQF